MNNRLHLFDNGLPACGAPNILRGDMTKVLRHVSCPACMGIAPKPKNAKTVDLRGHDDGSTIELNARDLRFFLRMVIATCDGNFDAAALKPWAGKILAQCPQEV